MTSQMASGLLGVRMVRKRLEGNYKDGKVDGKLTWWDENGQIEGEGNYKDGKEDGKFTSWDENGQINAELNYKDGKRVDQWGL